MNGSKRDPTQRVNELEARLLTTYRERASLALSADWRAGLMAELHRRGPIARPVAAISWSEELERTVFRFAASAGLLASAAAAYGLVAVWSVSSDILELAVDVGNLFSMQLFGL